jgi:hypothetical protein
MRRRAAVSDEVETNESVGEEAKKEGSSDAVKLDW